MTTSIFEPQPLEPGSPLRSPVGEAALSVPRALLVFGAALLCHAWLLRLPFQLDDYGVLAHPLSLLNPTHTEAGLTARMMRWPLVWLLGFLRAVTSEPLTSLPFHVVGLCLHGLAAVLLARCVSRFERTLEIPGAGVLSGLLFGLAGGHMQAVSWTAAWASMLYPLFGLLALESFLAARARESRGTYARAGIGRRRGFGGVCLYLALVCKAPAVVMTGALALFLFGLTLGSRKGSGAGRHLWSETMTLLCFGALAAISRYLALGTLELSYYDRPTPGFLEALGRIPRGVGALGQALVPWNARPVFEGSEPFSVLFTGARWSGPLLAALGFLPCALIALVAKRRLRAPFLLLIATLLVCVVPSGFVYQGPGSNLVGRTTYLALLVAASILGLGVAGTFTRSRALGLACGLWLLALTLDGTRHVSRIEGLAAVHRIECLDLVHSVATEQAASGSEAELVVLVIEDESGFGAIPALGSRVATALRPPFVTGPGWEAHVFDDGVDLLAGTAELDLARADVVVLGPELDADGKPRPAQAGSGGEAARARRAWRRHSGAFTGYVPEPASPEVFTAQGAGRWVTARPIQPHTARTLRVEVDRAAAAGPVILDGTLRVQRAEGDELSFPVRVPVGASGGVTFELPLAPSELFGAAWTGLRWEAGDSDRLPRAISTRSGLPELEFLGVPESSELSLGSGRIPHPRLLFRIPPEATRGQVARLSWSFATRAAPLRLSAAAEVSVRDGRFAFSPKRVRLDGPKPAEFPWGEFCRRFLIPYMKQSGGDSVELPCRLVLLLESGEITARSTSFSLRFEG